MSGRIRFIETLSPGDYHNRTYEIVDVQHTPAGANPYGPSKFGYIKMNCPLSFLRLIKPTSEDNERELGYWQAVFLSTSENMSPKAFSCEVSADVNVPSLEIRSNDELALCILSKWDPTNSPISVNAMPKHFGLVLRAKKKSPNEFERVAYVESLHDTLKDSSAWDRIKQHTISIF